MADAGAARRRFFSLQYIGLGCFTMWAGFFAGAMIAVFISKIVAFFTRAPSCPGLPSCNWWIYAAVGGGLGMVGLPAYVLSRVRRSIIDEASRQSSSGELS